jgi:hypothetical protein
MPAHDGAAEVPGDGLAATIVQEAPFAPPVVKT